MANWSMNNEEQKLLPTNIEDLAQKEPEALWAEYPTSPTTFDNGFSQITYAQFANAVNSIAHLIKKRLGRCDTGEPLAWLAPNDPRCSITLVAAMKAGFKLFLISERNSVAANHKLFDEVQCSTIVTTDQLFPPVQATQSGRELTLIELPPIQQLLDNPKPDYPYKKTLITSHDEVAFMVHTSGSTGFPKPMSISHGFMTKMVRDIKITAPKGYDSQTSMIGGKRCILLLPLGHPAGVNFGVLLAFFARTTVILPLPSVPPTGAALIQMLDHVKADWASLAPLTLETISKDLGQLDAISDKLKTLVFSGGSLPKVFGDVISSKLQLLSFIGSSETGPLPAIYHHGYDFKNDWNYLQFPPELGASFDPRPGGVYELVFKKTPETEPYQPVFTTHPELSEFRTKDLFTKHPTVPGLWTHASRSDDVIVFINGEKVNPIDYESQVSKHPDVAAALMFGQQRFEAGLLIELSDQRSLSVSDRAQIIQRLWPTIETANRILPAYAQVSQTHVCFTDPGKPVLRTLKGSIRRPATLELYKDKINQVYTDVEEVWTSGSGQVDLASVEEVKGIIREAIKETTKLEEVGETDDFFQRGMDSLQVLRLVRSLRIKTALRSINPSAVYLNPSISALSNDLFHLAHNEQTSEEQRREQKLDERAQILQKYMKSIDNVTVDLTNTVGHQPSKSEGQVVILTGSTGSIGSYILHYLLECSEIKHIYCLNRSSDSATVQSERNAQLNPALPSAFPESRVTFLTVDLSEPQTFGLPESTFETLRISTTLVIHNAWTVDFNIPLKSFEPQLGGVVNLCAFCARSEHQAALLFVSSISSTMNWKAIEPKTQAISEAIISDLRVSADAGYAESKYIGERILEYATQKLKLRGATVLRVGQIAGALHTPGRWNPADWVPALIQGSRELGVIPDSLGSGDTSDDNSTPEESNINWLPIDTAADSIVEIGIKSALSSKPGPVQVLHLLNPNRTSWKSLLPSIVTVLEAVNRHPQNKNTEPIKIVPPETWIAALRASATQSLDQSGSSEAQDAVLAANPALRLLGFFQMQFGAGGDNGDTVGRLTWETEKAEHASATLRAAEAINGEIMGQWVLQWFAKE